jgi:RNAse (barnase) inhibitor barstar
MSADWVTGNVAVERITEAGDPWLHMLVGRPGHARAIARYLNDRHTEARVVRGVKSRTSARFFDEISAALQFPDYFGQNWDALADCIEDMSWLRASAYTLLMTDADQLLADEPEHAFQVLIKTLARAARYWTSAEPEGGTTWPHSPLPFHVVLQVAQEHADGLARVLASHEWSYDTLNQAAAAS